MVEESWQPGDLVSLRGREWMIEQVNLAADMNGLGTIKLACISDAAQANSFGRCWMPK